MLRNYIIIVGIALLLVACGGDQSSAKPLDTASQPDVSESIASSVTKMVTEAEPVTASEPAETVVSTTTMPVTEPEVPSSYADLVNTVDRSYAFTTQAGEVTFGERFDAGFGNITGDGKAFCIIPDSGGAGQMIFKSFYTANGGGSWSEGDMVSMFTGKLQAFAAEDGRVVVIDAAPALTAKFPTAYILSLRDNDGGYIVSCEEDREYFKAFENLNTDKSCTVSIRYDGDLMLMTVISDSVSGETVYEAKTALDPVTLEPVLGDPAE